MTDDPNEPNQRPTTSTRDRQELHSRLVTWLAGKVTDPVVSELIVPESNGMSSETLLFEASWRENGAVRSQACVARLRPDPANVPVFPVYDLERQFRVMGLVAERSSVPVPRTLWFEPDDTAIGSPFFVMERVDGIVPPDIMPYPFGSWLSEADPVDQRRLQTSSVRVLAQLHDMDVTTEDLSFLELDRPGATALRRHVADSAAFYEWVAAEGARSPLIERAFAWLDEHWPADEGETVLSWGDSRIGNMMFRDFEPVAVLDWEMAAVGPREMDLAWMIYLHRFLDDLAVQMELPGMPDFMRLEDVASAYESFTGHTPKDLEFYTLYASLRHAIVMTRVARRSVLFGEMEMPVRSRRHDHAPRHPGADARRHLLERTVTNPIGPLLAGDEGFTHQIADTLAVVGTSDPSWTEKVCAMAAAKDGSLQLGFGLGKYTNRNVMDGYAGISRGVEQMTVRASRRLASDPETTVIGPIRYEVDKPLTSVVFSLEPNATQPVSFEWRFESIVPPFMEDRTHMRRGNRVGADLVRYHQIGLASGWVEIEGERTEISPETWVSTRDHSWGVRYDVGLPPQDLEPGDPLAGLSFRMIWSPIAMERPDGSRYGLFLHYQIFQGPGFVHKHVVMGGVESPDGSRRPLRRHRARADLRPGQPAPAGGPHPRHHGRRVGPHPRRGRRLRHRLPPRGRSLLRLRRPPPRRMARRPRRRRRAHRRLRRPGRPPAASTRSATPSSTSPTPPAAGRAGGTASPSSPVATTPSDCQPRAASCEATRRAPGAGRSAAAALLTCLTMVCVVIGPAAPVGATGSQPVEMAAPYEYLGWGDPPSPTQVMADAGVHDLTLAFILSRGKCDPAWDGTRPLLGGSDQAAIDAIRAAGGDVSVSFGGWSGTKLGTSCKTPAALAAAYEKVVDAYSLDAIDIDIEHKEVASARTRARVIAALAIVRQADPGLEISVTIGTDEDGPNPQDLSLIDDAAAIGFEPTAWTIMPFDFGTAVSDMGAVSIQAAEGLDKVLAAAYHESDAAAYGQIGISSMNGRTDETDETVSVADFESILSFAQTNHLARFTFWSVNRDRPCAGADTTSDSCSGIAQPADAFTDVVAQYHG